MDRCLNCYGTLKKTETECFLCGAKVPRETNQTIFRRRFATVVRIMFFISIPLTIASLFTDYTPSSAKCFAPLLVLTFVRNRADQTHKGSETFCEGGRV